MPGALLPEVNAAAKRIEESLRDMHPTSLQVTEVLRKAADGVRQQREVAEAAEAAVSVDAAILLKGALDKTVAELPKQATVDAMRATGAAGLRSYRAGELLTVRTPRGKWLDARVL